jgi:hypothetical protein
MALLDSRTDPASFGALPFFGWGVDVALVNPSRVAAWSAGGREVWTWTIKTPAHLVRASAAGVGGFITDVPSEVMKSL